MRKVAIVLTGVMLLAVGLLIGWFAAKRWENSHSALTVRYRVADPELLAPAPTWEEWKYPGSRVHNSSTGGGGTTGGVNMSGTARVTLLTADDFDKVLAYYQSKCKLRAPGAATISSRMEMSGTESHITYTLHDNVQPHSFEGPKSELLLARGFSVQSLRYNLVGFVYRVKGADETCIHLVYRPNSEFIGLLKDRLDKE